jgi:hypothetical protein
MTIDSDLTSSRNPRTHVDPTPFEIASIAAQLSKGKDPEKHLRPAIDLYRAAYSVVYQEFMDSHDMQSDQDDMVAAHERQVRFDQLNVWFDPNSDWDDLRKYLHGKGLTLKKAQTVRQNLRKYFKETGQPEKARKLRSDLSNGKTHILKTDLDELVQLKKGRRSDGGKRSHRTRQKRATRTIVAKKQKK